MDRGIPARLSPGEGRRFAWTVGTAFLALAVVGWWRGRPTLVIGFSAVSALLLAAGALVPARLGPVFRAWMGFGRVLSKLTTPVFMAITYYLIFSPAGFMLRMLGHRPLVRRPVEGSFWVPRPEGSQGKSDMQRQF